MTFGEKRKSKKLKQLSVLMDLNSKKRDEYLKNLNDSEKKDLINELEYFWNNGVKKWFLRLIKNLTPFIENIIKFYNENKDAIDAINKSNYTKEEMEKDDEKLKQVIKEKMQKQDINK